MPRLSSVLGRLRASPLAVRLADLPLKHPELMPEGKHLGAELGVGAGADEHEIGRNTWKSWSAPCSSACERPCRDDEAHELVGEAEKHGDGSCPMTHDSRRRRRQSVTPPRPEGRLSN